MQNSRLSFYCLVTNGNMPAIRMRSLPEQEDESAAETIYAHWR
jgi:hypothetical protein